MLSTTSLCALMVAVSSAAGQLTWRSVVDRGPVATLGRPVLVAAGNTPTEGSPTDGSAVQLGRPRLPRGSNPGPAMANAAPVSLGRPVVVQATYRADVENRPAPMGGAFTATAAGPLVRAVSAPDPLRGSLDPEDRRIGESTASREPVPGSSRSAYQDPGCQQPACFWVDLEFLLWRVKPGSISVPLVASGPPGVTALGADTHVLSPDSISYGNRPGFRLDAGTWFDQDRRMGVQAGFFLLNQASKQFSYATGADIPTLFIPLFNVSTGAEGSFTIADPAQGFTGGLTLTSTSRLGGFDADLLWNLVRCPNRTVDLMAGFRYLSLSESLTLSGTSSAIGGGDDFSFTDRFSTRSQFYGLDVGVRGTWMFDSFDLTGQARVAFGPTHHNVTLTGSSAGTLVTDPTVGLLVQDSNRGTHTRNSFAIVPEANVQLGYSFTPHVRVFAGYDFLWWSSVVRPGNQIDRNFNLDPANGPLAPQPKTVTSSFWAQGLSLGMTFRF